jgi:TRAP-type C4-dicarboxylate transport system permease small subunit
MAVTVGVDLLPKSGRKACAIIVETLMTVIAVFMVFYGIKLCQVTWNNSIADFPFLSVGLVYSPIPFGGILTLFFIVEHLTIGRPASAGRDPHLPVE